MMILVGGPWHTGSITVFPSQFTHDEVKFSEQGDSCVGNSVGDSVGTAVGLKVVPGVDG